MVTMLLDQSFTDSIGLGPVQDLSVRWLHKCLFMIFQLTCKIFPQEWKTAKAFIVFKTEKGNDPNNYRRAMPIFVFLTASLIAYQSLEIL